jgi:uncharacterized phiE125 gp8 family phage protein
MRILDAGGQPPEAVTVSEFKAATPLADSPDFDTAIAAQIAAATATVEDATRRPLAVRAVEILAPVTTGQGWRRWWFPAAPVAAVTAVAVWSDGGWVDLDPGDWVLESAHDEPQLVLAESVRAVFGGAAIRVQANLGHASGQIPQPLKQAVILIAQEWHMAGAGLGDTVPEVRSFAAHALIRQQRYSRPRVCV